MSRGKSSRFADFHVSAQILLAELEKRSLKFETTSKIELINDEPCNRLLEFAETCLADFIVTGNRNDFNMRNYQGTKIVSPKEFFELLNH